MKQNSKQALTPKLRFPEFRDEPGWMPTILRDVLTEHGLKSDGIAHVHSVSAHKGVIDQISHLGRSFAASDTSHYWLAKENDLIYTKSPLKEFPYGIVKRNQNPYSVIVSPLYGVFSPSNKHLSRLIDAYFESPERANSYLEPLVQKGAKNTLQISNGRFVSRDLYLPSDEQEQQKVADCLCSLDDVIAAQARTVEVLRALKDGLMQQLFPCGSETVPRLRFPEFRTAPAWEIESLDALYDFKPTNSFSREQLNYDKGEARNIHYGDIHTKFSATFRIGSERVPFVNLVHPLEAIKPDAYCLEGDMIFADASEDLKDIGKSIEIVDLRGEKVLSGSHTILARQKNEVFVLGFGAHLFKSQAVRTEIERVAQGTKVLGISPTRLAKVKVIFPRMKSEQNKIAGCLTALDDLTIAQTHHLDALKTHKAGLMQQLFPSPEESEA